MNRTQTENDYLEAVGLARGAGLILRRSTSKSYTIMSTTFGWLLNVRGDGFYWDRKRKGPHLPVRNPFTIKTIVEAVIAAEADCLEKCVKVDLEGSGFPLDPESECTSCDLPPVVRETGLCEECTSRVASL